MEWTTLLSTMRIKTDKCKMNELKLQSELINSARALGGYGLKLSNKFKSGVPDLLLCLPSYAACLVEVKYLGELNKNFSRTVYPSVIQGKHLEDFQKGNRGYGKQAFLLVGVTLLGTHWITIIDLDGGTVTTDAFTWRPRKTGCIYALDDLWPCIKVPRLRI